MKDKLLELVGILNEKEANELEEFIKLRRMASRKRLEKIAKKIKYSQKIQKFSRIKEIEIETY